MSGHERISTALSTFGFVTMITSGIIVYIIILDELTKFPFGLAALFSIPLVISTAVGIFVYLRKTKE